MVGLSLWIFIGIQISALKMKTGNIASFCIFILKCSGVKLMREDTWTSSDGVWCINHSRELYLQLPRIILSSILFEGAPLSYFREKLLDNLRARKKDKAHDYLSKGYALEYRGNDPRIRCFCRKKCIMHLLERMEEGNSLRLLAILLAAVLKKSPEWAMLHEEEICAMVHSTGRLSEGKKKLHIRRLRRLVGYLSSWEEPYYEHGRANVARYLESKAFTVQALIYSYVQFLGSSYDTFYNEFYELSKDDTELLGEYFTRRSSDIDSHTESERYLLEHEKAYEYHEVIPLSPKRLKEAECELHKTHDTVDFINYGSNAILSLLCTMFCSNGTYSLEHLPNAKPELRSFFRKHRKPFEWDDDIALEWSMVLSSMDSSEVLYKGARSVTTEKDIAAGGINLLFVLGNLCGLENELPSTREKTLDTAIVDRLEMLTCSRELLGRICCNRQYFDLEIGHRIRGTMRNSGPSSIDKGIDIGFRVMQSGKHWVDFKFICGDEGFDFAIKACSCVPNSMPVSLEVDSLLDFFLDLYARKEENFHMYKKEVRRLTEQNPEYLFFLRGDNCCGSSAYLHLLDSAIRSQSPEPLPQRAAKRIDDRAAYLCRAYKLVARHRKEGGRLDPGRRLSMRKVLDLASSCKLINLVSYILENEAPTKGELQEAVLLLLEFGRFDVLRRLDAGLVRRACEENELFWSYLSICLQIADSCAIDHIPDSMKKTPQMSWELCDVECCFRGVYLRALVDPAVSNEHIKRVYEWGYLILEKMRKFQAFSHLEYLPFLIEYAHEKQVGTNLIDYVQPFLGRAELCRFVPFFLKFLLRNCIYLPYAMCSELEELYGRVPLHANKRWRYLFDEVLRLLSNIKYEGLSVTGDRLSEEGASFLLGRNAMNKRIFERIKDGYRTQRWSFDGSIPLDAQG
jgi:hypothetical protein